MVFPGTRGNRRHRRRRHGGRGRRRRRGTRRPRDGGRVASPENIAFFLAHTSGVICVPLTNERADSSTCPSWSTPTPRPSARRSRSAWTTGTAPRRHLGRRPLVDDCRVDRPVTRPTTSIGRAHLPLRYRQRGAEAGRPQPRQPSTWPGALTPPRALRDRDRGQGRDAGSRAGPFRRGARAPVHLDRRPDPLPRRNEKLVRRVARRASRRRGEFTAHVYESVLDGEQHLAFVMGDVAGHDNVLVRCTRSA